MIYGTDAFGTLSQLPCHWKMNHGGTTRRHAPAVSAVFALTSLLTYDTAGERDRARFSLHSHRGTLGLLK